MAQAGDRPQIVVTGDITLDWNLARLSDDRVASTWDPDDSARVCAQAGGAAMLAEVVGALAERRGFELRSFPPPHLDRAPGRSPYPESYATWAPHANPRGADPAWVWRVTGYLGLDRARAAANGADPW